MEITNKPKTEILKVSNAVDAIAFYSLLYKANERRKQETENVNGFLINNELMQVINQRKNNTFRPEDLRKMKRFIAQGADPKTTFEQWGDRISLLTLGIINNNTDFVKFLLDRGVDPTIPDDNSSKEKETPLGRMQFIFDQQRALNENQKEMRKLFEFAYFQQYENLEQKNEDINDLIAEKNNLLEKLKSRKYTFQNPYNEEKEKFENERLSTESIQLTEEANILINKLRENKITIKNRTLRIEKINSRIQTNDRDRIDIFYAMRRKEGEIERKLMYDAEKNNLQKYYSPEEISKMIEIRKKELSFPETIRYDALSNRLQKENMWLKNKNLLLQIDKESLEKTNIILEETIHHKKNLLAHKAPPKILEKPIEEID